MSSFCSIYKVIWRNFTLDISVVEVIRLISLIKKNPPYHFSSTSIAYITYCIFNLDSLSRFASGRFFSPKGVRLTRLKSYIISLLHGDTHAVDRCLVSLTFLCSLQTIWMETTSWQSTVHETVGRRLPPTTAVSSVSPGRLHLYMNCHIVQYSAVRLFTSSSLFTSVYASTTKIICRSCSRSLCLSFSFFFILFWCAWQAMLGMGFHGNCMLNRHAWCLRVNHRQWRHSPLWSDRQKKTEVPCRHRGVPVIFLSLWWRVVRCFGFSFWLSEEKPLKMHWGKWGIIHAKEIWL